LKSAITSTTLVEGCEQGTFVLRLTRPDGTSRSWWRSRPDENALNDPAMELVLPESAELSDIAPALLTPKRLPEMWHANEIAVKAVFDYFGGKTVVQVDRGGYQEPMQIPKASQEVVETAIAAAVEDGAIWLLSGPASILGEPIPAGVLNASSKLCVPPAPIAAAEILPENLKDAWKDLPAASEGTAQADSIASGLSILTTLSVKAGKTLPWKTVRDVISGALQAWFLALDAGSRAWPCDLPSAQFVTFTTCREGMEQSKNGAGWIKALEQPKMLVAVADLEPSEVQNLSDIIPKLLEVKTKANVPLRFQIRIEMGDGKTMPSAETAQKVNAILKDVKEGLELR